jgi:type II secretory pathway component GspD/PulD (secretin)
VPSRPRGQGVVFKFDNADLYEVIRTMAEILKINYVIDPRVRGTSISAPRERFWKYLPALSF